MPKPTTVSAWSTNPGTTTDPGDARRATGFLPGRKLPAKWLNWLLAQTGAWLSYLSNLHIEPEFLNKHYTWQGVQEFIGPTLIKGVMDVTSTNVKFAGLRTTSDIGLAGFTQEVIYTNALGVADPRLRVVTYPLGMLEVHGTVNTLPELVRNPPSYYWLSKTAGTVFIASLTPLALPRGARIFNITVGVYNDHDSTITVDASLVNAGVNVVTPSAGTSAVLASTSQGINAGLNLIATILPLSPVTAPDNGSTELYVRINISSMNVRLYWVRVAYYDPGPRNG